MALIQTPEGGADRVRRRRFHPALAERVLIGLVLGVAAGIFFGEMTE
jgi:Na+/H+-dicarboxylate symporter